MDDGRREGEMTAPERIYVDARHIESRVVAGKVSLRSDDIEYIRADIHEQHNVNMGIKVQRILDEKDAEIAALKKRHEKELREAHNFGYLGALYDTFYDKGKTMVASWEEFLASRKENKNHDVKTWDSHGGMNSEGHT